MNTLTSRQRKLLYVGCIGVLLVPIIWLGIPAGSEDKGGQLAQLRTQHELGESTLGDVDPSSSAMNLVLLGLRGPAASILRLDAEELQKTKNWGKLKAIVETIVKLQPHYIKVWEFQGWNLAYNVSQAWDATEDRYFWVKEGIKFQQRGSSRNKKNADLVWHTGNLFGRKIGNSDEHTYFRKYFRDADPNPTFNGKPDPAINGDGKDNWEVAHEEFKKANALEDAFGQSIMATTLFRQYPAHCYIALAMALQEEGKFEGESEEAWKTADGLWNSFGNEEFFMFEEQKQIKYILESRFADANPDNGDEDGMTPWIKELALENFVGPPFDEWSDEKKFEEQLELTDIQVKTVNYGYWRQLIRVEKDPEMAKVHGHFFAGRAAFRSGDTSGRGPKGELPSRAQAEFEQGMTKLETIFEKYPDLQDDSLLDEAMLAVMYWRDIHIINGEEPPDEFPLKKIWTKHQDRMRTVQEKFNREMNSER